MSAETRLYAPWAETAPGGGEAGAKQLEESEERKGLGPSAVPGVGALSGDLFT